MKGMFEVLETIPRKLLGKTQALSIRPCGPLLKTGNHFPPFPLCHVFDIKISLLIMINIFYISLFSRNECQKQYQHQILINQDKKKIWPEEVNKQVHSLMSSTVPGTGDTTINNTDLIPVLMP